MKKKQVALLLAATMALTSLVGCGNNEQEVVNTEKESTTKVESTENSESVVEEVKNFNETGYPIVNEEITLKVLINARDSDNWIEVDEMPAIKRMEEETGINLEWEVVKSSDWATKTNLMFASGEYPDLIIAQEKDIDFEEYGVVQKVLLPLDDLIDQYLPSYTERMELEDYDPTATLVASDGQTYSVGYMNGTGHVTSTVFAINQEWLDALKLPMPTNKEEFVDTLRAFKTQDPNGNGQADEIPWSARCATNSITTSLAAFLSWFGMPYDSYSSAPWIYIDSNKEIQFIPTQENFRECMEWLHELYAEGLIDAEVFSQDSATHTAKVKNGVVGFSSANNPASNWGAETAAKFSAYVPEEGTCMEKIEAYANPCAYITVTNEFPEATMRLLEYMIDPVVQWTLYVGEEVSADGHSGWKINDAGLLEQWQDDKYEAPALADSLGVCGLFVAPLKTYQKYYQAATRNIYKYNITDQYVAAGILQEYSSDYFDLVKITPEQNEMLSLLKTELGTTMSEHFATFVKDGVTDASWDAYVKIFDGMKIDEYMKIYQDGINGLDLD